MTNGITNQITQHQLQEIRVNEVRELLMYCQKENLSGIRISYAQLKAVCDYIKQCETELIVKRIDNGTLN